MGKRVIILSRGDEVDAYGSLTEICRKNKDFSYHYLKSKKYPFSYKGWEFNRVGYHGGKNKKNFQK